MKLIVGGKRAQRLPRPYHVYIRDEIQYMPSESRFKNSLVELLDKFQVVGGGGIGGSLRESNEPILL